MKHVKVFLFMAIALSVSQVSLAKCKIDDATDEFTKIRIIKQTGNETEDTFGFNLLYKPNEKQLGLQVIYWGSSWLFIEPGTSLKFLADGDLIEIPVVNSDRQTYRVMNRVCIREDFIVTISPDTMRKLMAAKSLKCRLYGRRNYVETEKMENVQACWSEFMSRYVQE